MSTSSGGLTLLVVMSSLLGGGDLLVLVTMTRLGGRLGEVIMVASSACRLSVVSGDSGGAVAVVVMVSAVVASGDHRGRRSGELLRGPCGALGVSGATAGGHGHWSGGAVVHLRSGGVVALLDALVEHQPGGAGVLVGVPVDALVELVRVLGVPVEARLGGAGEGGGGAHGGGQDSKEEDHCKNSKELHFEFWGELDRYWLNCSYKKT